MLLVVFVEVFHLLSFEGLDFDVGLDDSLKVQLFALTLVEFVVADQPCLWKKEFVAGWLLLYSLMLSTENFVVSSVLEA